MYKFHINAHERVEGVWWELKRSHAGPMGDGTEGRDHAFPFPTDE